MKLGKIRSRKQYREAMARCRELMLLHPADRTAEGDELDLLIILLQEFESRTVPPALPLDPIDAIEFRMDQMGLTPADMVPYFGTRSRVSEVLGRKRPLTLNMIRRLNDGLGIPLDTLVRSIELDEDARKKVA